MALAFSQMNAEMQLFANIFALATNVSNVLMVLLCLQVAKTTINGALLYKDVHLRLVVSITPASKQLRKQVSAPVI